ncbi:uncharacterized protein [Eurosta solidaginis]|uniref:uncharacterized protein isoform X2 n=1 Tax=Eurosta solidaginis TaxID=178769 RepID=UPI003530CC81
MLFAACTTAAPKPLQLTSHVANNLGQQQLTYLQQLKDRNMTSLSSSSSMSSLSTSTPNMSPKHQVASKNDTKVSAAAVTVATATRANEEAKEAMRKLDATLVAYLAGETKLQPKQTESKLEFELNSSNDSSTIADEYVFEEFVDTAAVEKSVENLTREELQVFRSIKSVKLQLEALTLEPEGTKRMELLQNETRPIFTVECQLSHELIKHLPRYEMFHIMQFESEKFHSLTQSTRFAQEAQRDINLTPLIDELDYMTKNGAMNADDMMTTPIEMPNFGRIHFTVWWREPGTCLNEMLGMGVFELRELYDAALLEQCKRIKIQRRGVTLANIYLKINLLLCTLADTYNNNNSNNIILGGERQAAIKQHHPSGGDKQKQQQKAENSAAGSGNTNTTSAASAGGTSCATTVSSNTTANSANPGDNNNIDVDTSSHFNSATLKIRLLTGIIYAYEVRNMPLCSNSEYHLVCERFWKTEPAASVTESLHKLFYQELPVIAIDDWVPIINEAREKIGEMKCLLAIGSESQINYLKAVRDLAPLDSDMFSGACSRPGQDIRMPSEDIQNTINAPEQQKPKSIQRTADLMQMLQQALQQTRSANNTTEANSSMVTTIPASGNAYEAVTAGSVVRLSERTFQFELNIECAASLPENAIPKGKSGKNATKRLASKRFPPGEAPTTYVTFQADMCSGSSGLYNSHEGKVYATDVVERSTNPRWAQRFWVTVDSEYLENPNQNFILKLWKKANVPPANGNGNVSATCTARLLPKPCDDAILGFTSLDLSVFLRGMHIGGIFNVIDFNGRINGQLYLNAKPMDGWYVRYLAQRISQHPTQEQRATQRAQDGATETIGLFKQLEEKAAAQGATAGGYDSIENVIEQFGNTINVNLGQAVKQKYNELEDISKRLRARLIDVTGEQIDQQQHLDLQALDNWLPFNDVVVAEQANDSELNEFERDINTNIDVDMFVDDEGTNTRGISNMTVVVEDELSQFGDIESDNNKDSKEQMISKTSH